MMGETHFKLDKEKDGNSSGRVCAALWEWGLDHSAEHKRRWIPSEEIQIQMRMKESIIQRDGRRNLKQFTQLLRMNEEDDSRRFFVWC